MTEIKKQVTYINPADHSDHIINHVIQQDNTGQEIIVKLDYHVQ